MKFNDIFEEFEKLPQEDFSELKEKQSYKFELEEYANKILAIQDVLHSMKDRYTEAVNAEMYEDAEEITKKYNNTVDLLNELKAEFKTAIHNYERKYKETVYVSSIKNMKGHYCTFHKNKVIVT